MTVFFLKIFRKDQGFFPGIQGEIWDFFQKYQQNKHFLNKLGIFQESVREG